MIDFTELRIMLINCDPTRSRIGYDTNIDGHSAQLTLPLADKPIIDDVEVYFPTPYGYITVLNDRLNNVTSMQDEDGNIQCYCMETENTMISLYLTAA